MLKSLITTALLTMGVGVTTPTPNFIKAETPQNTQVIYEQDQPNLEYDTETLEEDYTYYNWVNVFNQHTEKTIGITNNKIAIREQNSNYYMQGYEGIITEEEYETIKNDNLWNIEPGYENTSLAAVKIYNQEIKTNATITISYAPVIKYLGCKWLSKVKLYYGSYNRLEEIFNKIINGDGVNEPYSNNYSNYIGVQLDQLSYSSNLITTAIDTKYGEYTITNTGSQLIWTNPSNQESNFNINLNYSETTYIIAVIQTFYIENTNTQYGYINYNSTKPLVENGYIVNDIKRIKLSYLIPTTSINYEVINIPDLMFTILTTPFAFISQAFNLTLFPGTPYAINISNLFLCIFGIILLISILMIALRKH